MSGRSLVNVALFFIYLSASVRMLASASCWGSSIHGAKLSPSKSLYDAGDEVTVACKSYGITERKKITCTTVKWWTEWVPNLENYCGSVVTCNARDTIVHPKIYTTPGFITWYKPGQKVTLHCPEGYDLTGTKTTTCRSGRRFGNGYFSPDIKKSGCKAQPAICQMPSSVPNGVLSPTKSTFGAGEKVTLLCGPTYIPDGPSKSTCIRRSPPTPGAKWDAEFKACKRDPMTVCKLKNMHFRHITQEKDMYEVGETITLSCHDLYTSDEAKKSTCMPGSAGYNSGYWKPKFSDCKPYLKVSCKLNNFRDTVIAPKKDLYKVGEVISIKCSKGYASASPPEVTCTAGKNEENAFWKPNIQECERVGCERHPWISNGDFEPFKWFYNIGETIKIKCEDGTEPEGPDESDCLLDGHTGKWKPLLGKCKESRCVAPTVTGASISPVFDAYNVGDTIDVFCITKRTGSISVEPSARSVCTKNRDDRHPEFNWEPSVEGICDDQTCLHRSGNLNEKININRDFYLPGESISLTCRDGFTVQGQTSSTCTMKDEKAKWEPVLGECIKDNCDAPRVYGATLEPAKSHYLPGEKVKVICVIHTDIEPKETKCTTSTKPWGHWKPNLENYCGKEIGCDMQTMVIHPNMYTVPRIVTWLKPGEQVTLHCFDGYELVGEKTSTCMAGASWGQGYYDPDVTKASCKELPPPCDSPIVPQNGQFIPAKESYTLGEVLSLSCDKNYIPDGATKSTCVRKDPDSKVVYLEPAIGECKRDPDTMCIFTRESPLQLTNEYLPGKDLYEVGDSIEVSCAQSFEPTHQQFVTCEYSKVGKAGWNPMLIQCVVLHCDIPPSSVRAGPRPPYVVGMGLPLRCEQGFKMEGPNFSVCNKMDGAAVWEPPIGFCVFENQDSACALPWQTHMTLATKDQLFKDSYEVGESITVSCSKGFKSAAPQKLTCEKGKEGNATWNPPLIPCDGLFCVPPPPWVRIRPLYREYRNGMRIRLLCEQGYTVKGSISSYCTDINGMAVWEPQLGECVLD